MLWSGVKAFTPPFLRVLCGLCVRLSAYSVYSAVALPYPLATGGCFVARPSTLDPRLWLRLCRAVLLSIIIPHFRQDSLVWLNSHYSFLTFRPLWPLCEAFRVFGVFRACPPLSPGRFVARPSTLDP